MPVKVVMQNELSMGATDRIREMAEVVVDPELEQVSGADIVVAAGGPIDAEFMSRAGNRLKMVATPGIGVDKNRRGSGERARHYRHPQPRGPDTVHG